MVGEVSPKNGKASDHIFLHFPLMGFVVFVGRCSNNACSGDIRPVDDFGLDFDISAGADNGRASDLGGRRVRVLTIGHGCRRSELGVFRPLRNSI